MFGPPPSGELVATFHNGDCVTVYIFCDILRVIESDKDAIVTHVETEDKKDNPEDSSGESSKDTNDSMTFRYTFIMEGVALENLESCSQGHDCSVWLRMQNYTRTAEIQAAVVMQLIR